MGVTPFRSLNKDRGKKSRGPNSAVTPVALFPPQKLRKSVFLLINSTQDLHLQGKKTDSLLRMSTHEGVAPPF